jgi:hypothetical protein
MKLRIGVLALMGVLPLVLTACGGGGNKAEASSSTTPSSDGAGDTSAFTKCLSDHGVTLPSGADLGRPGGSEGGPPNGELPNPGDGGGPPGGTFPGGNNSDFQEAIQACRSKLPNGGQGFGGNGSQNAQAFQAYTSCLKDHGVNVPSGASGASGAAGPGAIGDLQSDPKFASANKTCQALLPSRAGSTTTTVGN